MVGNRINWCDEVLYIGALCGTLIVFPNRHGEAVLYLVSLVHHTGDSCVTLVEPPYYQLALDLFTPEG
jgi:hypothetical protein